MALPPRWSVRRAIRGAAAAAARACCAAALRQRWLRRSAVRMIAPFPGLRARALRLAFPPAAIATAGPKMSTITARADQLVQARLGRSGRQIYRQLRVAVDTHAG